MLQTILLGVLGGSEILIILIIVLILFGGRKIPELMRGIGKGVREFKDGMDGVGEHSNNQNTGNKGQQTIDSHSTNQNQQPNTDQHNNKAH